MTQSTAAAAIAALPTPSRFLREARALDAAEIVPLCADVAVVEKNVAAGVGAVFVYTDHIAEHLPKVDLGELRSLPDLARDVVEAARAAGGGGDEERELFGEADKLRRSLRAAALALAEAEVLSARDVAKLGNGRGAVDVGAECKALAGLFERRADEVEGKTAIDAEQVARAAEVGATLRALLRGKGAARKPGPHGPSPVEVRDRLWTLLVMRHERLWAVGAYVFGHAVDDHVPPLCAPAGARR